MLRQVFFFFFSPLNFPPTWRRRLCKPPVPRSTGICSGPGFSLVLQPLMFWLLENLDDLHPEWDKNHVATRFWLCVDMRLSGAGRCFNLSQRNLHSSWGVNSFLWVSARGGTNKRRHRLWFFAQLWDAMRNSTFNVCGEMWPSRLQAASWSIRPCSCPSHQSSVFCHSLSWNKTCTRWRLGEIDKKNKQTSRIKVWALVQVYKKEGKTGWLAGFCSKWNKMLLWLFWLNVHTHICM